MAVDVTDLERVDRSGTRHAAAADIRRGDQVAFSSDEDARVAGEVTGMRYTGRRSPVVVVVGNRVHFLPADHPVLIDRPQTDGADRSDRCEP